MNKNSKTITLGDKIFARVSRNGRTLYNFVSEKVTDMTDLITQLRQAMKDFHGLVMIHIRNYNQGWGDERPLMLYAEKPCRYNGFIGEETIRANNRNQNRMLFPWDTH